LNELTDLAPRDKRIKLTELLHARPYLLLLQNLHLKPEGCFDDLLTLLADLNGNSFFVITSRMAAMPIYGHYRVIHFEPLNFEDSVKLLKADATARGVLQLQGTSEEVLRAIYASTYGIPLALRMVVSQARFLDVSVILNRLQKQRGIANLYEILFRQSWDQLSVLSKNLLARLALDESAKTWDQVIQFALVEDENALIEALDQLSSYSLIDVIYVDQRAAYRVDAVTRNFLRADLHSVWDKPISL